MKPVTDPAVLAQLNGDSSAPALKPVTDPSLLAQLNGQQADSDEPRLSQKIASGIGKAVDYLDPKPDDPVRAAANKRGEQTLESATLSMDSMLQAVRQYTTGMVSEDERKKSTQAAQDIDKRMNKLPSGPRIAGEVGSAMIPFGGAGKLATGAKALEEMSSAEKVIQALKTISMGGAANAALTPATDDKTSFGEQKATQAAEGAAGTAVLGGAGKVAGKIWNAGKNFVSPQERAAAIQKLVEGGFPSSDIKKVSEKSKDATEAVEAAAKDAVKQPTSGGKVKTNEELGQGVQTALTGRQKELEAMRELQTGPVASEARKSPRPIPTQGVLNMLRDEAKLSKETAEGKSIYESVMKELTGYNALPQNSVSMHAIPSSKYEAVRAQIKELVEKGYNGKPLDERRAKVLNDASNMLDQSARKAVPKWGEFLDKYKQLSKPLDAFKRQEGAQIGKVTKTDTISNAKEMPGEKVVDHLIEGGPTRVRAAITASGNAPEVAKAVEHRLWQQVSEMSANGKMTPSAIDSFMHKHGDVLKELNLTPKFEVARNQLKAADAINKTAIGKMAKSAGSSSDSFNTLGSILRAGEGQRGAGLKELASLTAKDPEAREALRYGIVMQMVTESPGTAQLSRQAILPDLEKSGLFSKKDMENVQAITSEFDKAMKIGLSPQPKTVLEHIVGGALKAAGKVIPYGKPIAAFISGAGDTVMKDSLTQSRNILTMAAIDPEEAKLLLSVPTEKTIQQGLSAMQRAGIYMTVNQALK